MKLLLSALVATLFLLACGEDESDGDRPDAPAKPEFIAQANKLCAKGNAEVDAAFSKVKSNADAVDVIRETYVPVIQEQIDDVRALGFPEGDEDELAAYLDQAETILGQVEADPESLIAANERGETPFEPVNQKLAGYGLTACAGEEG